jgi:hypothetical protein
MEDKLQADLNDFKNMIIQTLKAKDLKDWNWVNLVFEFPPYINKGFTGRQSFEGIEKNKVGNTLF